jgi:hypothetical protein
MHRQAPAESDLERHFRVSLPAIHDMINTPERNGLAERTPGQARSIRLLVKPENRFPLMVPKRASGKSLADRFRTAANPEFIRCRPTAISNGKSACLRSISG